MKSTTSKLQQLNNIVDGWTNLLKGNSEALEIAKKRLSTCLVCPEMVQGKYLKFIADKPLQEAEGFKCKKCKCPLSAKLRSINETCPLNKW